MFLKRILYITDNFPPEVNAPAIRARDHLKYLQQLGHQVDLITGQPNYPMGKIFDGYTNLIIQQESITRGSVFRVWTFMAPNIGIVKRMMDHLSFMFSSILLGLNLYRKGRRYDVVLSTSPQFFSILAGVVLAKAFGADSVVEIRDLWPETIKNTLSINRFSFIYDIFYTLSRYIYRTADKIIPVTPGFATYIRDNNRLKRSPTVVENAIDGIPKVVATNNSRISDQKINVCYVGTLGVAQNIPFLIQSILGRPSGLENIRLHIAGAGMHSDAVSALAKKNPDEIEYYGMLNRNEAYSLIFEMDLALIPLINEPSYRTIIPSKIFELAALGIPILISGNCEGAGIVSQFGAGELFAYGDSDSFYAGVQTLYQNKSRYLKGLGEITQEYTRKKKAAQLSRAIEEL